MYRINKLLKQDRKLYHTNDLAILWHIANKNTLHVTISRYVASGVLHPIYKGLYATVPVGSLDPVTLGRAIIHRFTYMTTETVLARTGVISQATYDYTFAAEISKRIQVGPWSFRYRQLKDKFLYNPAGIVKDNDNFIASIERAAADMLYFNPKANFDVPQLVDHERLKALQAEIGY